MKTKKFDCVEMKREGSEKILSLLENMTLPQQLAYWKNAEKRLKGKIASNTSTEIQTQIMMESQ